MCLCIPQSVNWLISGPIQSEKIYGRKKRHDMKQSKIGTVALVVRADLNQDPQLVETFSDDQEIAIFEAAVEMGETQHLEAVYEMRARQSKEDDEFGDYVEDLLCQPFVRPEILEHGVQWLKSKIRIEQFQRCEREATDVIAGYAFKLYREDPKRTDFMLAGPSAKVRIKIYNLSTEDVMSRAA